MYGYIDGVNFSELPAEKYWSFPKTYKGNRKEETKYMITSGDYYGSLKRDGHYARFIKDEDGNMMLQGRTKSVSGDFLNKIDFDKYGESIDYSQDKRTVEFFDFDKCSNYNITGDNENNLCIKIKPLYWREQCLGPRDAYWDKERPKGFGGILEHIKKNTVSNQSNAARPAAFSPSKHSAFDLGSHLCH